MGLFNQFKQAMSKDNIRRGLQAGAQSLDEQLRNPQNVARDAAFVNQYGQELQRLAREGIPGEGTIRDVREATGTQPATPGSEWKTVETEIVLPGRAPYLASMQQLIPHVTADQFQPGMRYRVAVDQNDPHTYAFTGPIQN